VREIVLDHHLTRDIKWKDQISKIFDKADEHGVKIESAAVFGGIEEELLEAMRKKLYISQRES